MFQDLKYGHILARPSEGACPTLPLLSTPRPGSYLDGMHQYWVKSCGCIVTFYLGGLQPPICKTSTYPDSIYYSEPIIPSHIPISPIRKRVDHCVLAPCHYRHHMVAVVASSPTRFEIPARICGIGLHVSLNGTRAVRGPNRICGRSKQLFEWAEGKSYSQPLAFLLDGNTNDANANSTRLERRSMGRGSHSTPLWIRRHKPRWLPNVSKTVVIVIWDNLSRGLCLIRLDHIEVNGLRAISMLRTWPSFRQSSVIPSDANYRSSSLSRCFIRTDDTTPRPYSDQEIATPRGNTREQSGRWARTKGSNPADGQIAMALADS
ncbi:hypothetical protein BDN71DRAFT_1435768 [Pleurotus eryngii]|uniref:Uncharacterized protein n=1 Tax=Pleurotus eryngii TaxID=5323 RepID=A0A9P5ZLQ3_PLEER|nr:hypothetical protein BDN71DRAFT_1435768 [Pleurotus eryngii]